MYSYSDFDEAFVRSRVAQFSQHRGLVALDIYLGNIHTSHIVP